MRAAIYSPYLDTLGGGERYVMSVAATIRDIGWDVYVESRDSSILEKITRRLGINTEGLKLVESIKRGEGYDLCFWLSDGSIPTLFARKNILHFQRPFYDVDGRSIINRMKFFRINAIVVNSQFTKKWIDKEYPKKSIVIYPPVDVESFKPGKKENIILAVGRFSHLEQSKRQDVLLDTFKDMYDRSDTYLRQKKWRLVLAGGSDVGRTELIDKLKHQAKTYPIDILENKPFSEIKKLYSKAKIFWTASGFGLDEKKTPEKVEHFGITVVEAMSAGAVPFAYNSGGHKESITSGVNGYLWKSQDELSKLATNLLNDKKLMVNIAKRGKEDSTKYSYRRFENEIKKLLD